MTCRRNREKTSSPIFHISLKASLIRGGFFVDIGLAQNIIGNKRPGSENNEVLGRFWGKGVEGVVRASKRPLEHDFDIILAESELITIFVKS